MFDPDGKDEQPTVVEYEDGSTATLPSVAEFRRIANEADAEWERMKTSGFMRSLLNFDLNQP